MNRNVKFIKFMESLTTPANKKLLEYITMGYKACFENAGDSTNYINAIKYVEIDDSHGYKVSVGLDSNIFNYDFIMSKFDNFDESDIEIMQSETERAPHAVFLSLALNLEPSDEIYRGRRGTDIKIDIDEPIMTIINNSDAPNIELVTYKSDWPEKFMNEIYTRGYEAAQEYIAYGD